jgi:hypothetical protein
MDNEFVSGERGDNERTFTLARKKFVLPLSVWQLHSAHIRTDSARAGRNDRIAGNSDAFRGGSR